MKKLIRTNNKGTLSYNIHKNEFYIEFGNVQFKLIMDDYLVFERKLKKLANESSSQLSTEKIIIAVEAVGISLVLTEEELMSLCDLFGFKSSAQLMSFKMQINYSIN